MKSGTVTIHAIPVDADHHGNHRRLLSPDERVRAASFVFPKHAAHWIACRAALRRILGEAIQVAPDEVPLDLTPLGKPVLAEPFAALHFSLSHCEDLALLALCTDGPVGVDVEPSHRAPDLIGCENSFCHAAEINSLPAEAGARGRRLLEIWTAKEALLKAIGTGFSHPPESLLVHSRSATSEIPLPGIESQTLHRLEDRLPAGHCAAYAAPATASILEFHSAAASTSRDSHGMSRPRRAHPDG
jgi:4'-phosphopantetheinyl transferase